MWMPFSPMRAQISGFAPQQPLGAYPWQEYVHSGDGLRLMKVCTECLLPPLF